MTTEQQNAPVLTPDPETIEKRGYVPSRGPEPQPQDFSNLPSGPAPGAAPANTNQSRSEDE